MADASTSTAKPASGVAEWIEKHVAPDVEKAKDDINDLKALGQKVLAFSEAHAANADQLANLVSKFIQAADPAAAPLVAALQAEATRVASEAHRIAVEVLGQPGHGGTP